MMKMDYIFVFLTLVIQFQISCKQPEILPNKSTAKQQTACGEWENTVSNLTPKAVESLKKNGAVIAAHGDLTLLIISEDLVADCNLRGQMSWYFGRILFSDDNDENNPTDRQFVAQYSKEIVAVLRRIWESLSGSTALVGDGDFFEFKYALLGDPAFAEHDIGPLISDILDAEAIDNSLARIIFLRPMPERLRPALVRMQERVEKHESLDIQKHVNWQILNLSILSKMQYPQALPKLKRLDKYINKSESRWRTLHKIINKLEHNRPIEFSDVEELEN